MERAENQKYQNQHQTLPYDKLDHLFSHATSK